MQRSVEKRRSSFYRGHGKRALDLALAVPATILLAPLMALIAGLVRVRLGRPVFFRQERAGRDGTPFRMTKFRTMTQRRDGAGRLLPDSDRLTRFGRFLRRTSLDELPELLDVIGGEMSLVGPRPLLVAYLDHYSERHARRHEVRPGITGWAQVNGRNAISWNDRFELDVWYVDHCSARLDVKVLWLTLLAVLRRDGISAAGHATMPAFAPDRRSKALDCEEAES